MAVRQRKVPMRMCTGCGQMKPKAELVRVVKAPEKGGDQENGAEAAAPDISLDLTGKKPGRGAYVCRDPECLRLMRKNRRLERAFSCRIPPEVYDKLEGELAADG